MIETMHHTQLYQVAEEALCEVITLFVCVCVCVCVLVIVMVMVMVMVMGVVCISCFTMCS